MTKIRKNYSQVSDQPAHKNLEPVDLACTDLRAIVHLTRSDQTEIIIENLSVKNATMDQYGVGYKLQISDGKTWKDGLLSRRNFGIDNFSTSMKMGQTASSGLGHSVHPSSFIKIQCRAWHWKGDEEIAKKALIDAVDFSIKAQLESLKSLCERFSAERLVALPEPAKMPKTKKSSP